MMPLLFADSWVSLLKELRLSHMHTLDEVKVQSSLMMCAALEMRRTSLTAPIMDYLFTTVDTTRMLESGARVSEDSLKQHSFTAAI